MSEREGVIFKIYKQVGKGEGGGGGGFRNIKDKFGKGKEVRKRGGVMVGKYPKEGKLPRGLEGGVRGCVCVVISKKNPRKRGGGRKRGEVIFILECFLIKERGEGNRRG